MPISSAAEGFSLPDVKEDRKTAVRVGQYKISENAIYIPAFPFDTYVPHAALQRAWIQNATMQLTGCCGQCMPLCIVRVQYPIRGGEIETHNFTFDDRKTADRFMQIITAARPELETTPPEIPVRGKIG